MSRDMGIGLRQNIRYSLVQNVEQHTKTMDMGTTIARTAEQI